MTHSPRTIWGKLRHQLTDVRSSCYKEFNIRGVAFVRTEPYEIEELDEQHKPHGVTLRVADTGAIVSAEFYKHGRLHNEYGPAMITLMKMEPIYNKKHTDDEQAKPPPDIRYNGGVYCMRFYLDGKQLEEHEIMTLIKSGTAQINDALKDSLPQPIYESMVEYNTIEPLSINDFCTHSFEHGYDYELSLVRGAMWAANKNNSVQRNRVHISNDWSILAMM